MSYVRLSNGKLRKSNGVVFPWDESDPNFPAFLAWLEAGGTLKEVYHEEVPEFIEKWQAKTILSRAGLLDLVEQAVEASEDPEVKIAYKDAPRYARRSRFILAMAGAIGLDEATIDYLFIEGAKIS